MSFRPKWRNLVVCSLIIMIRRELLLDNRQYYVYILTNWNHKVMYIGMTNNLQRRVYEHKHHAYEGFTDKYNVSKLVYVESTTDVCAAIAREKQLKRWRRQKKNRLVESINSNWNDLSAQWGCLIGKISPLWSK